MYLLHPASVLLLPVTTRPPGCAVQDPKLFGIQPDTSAARSPADLTCSWLSRGSSTDEQQSLGLTEQPPSHWPCCSHCYPALLGGNLVRSLYWGFSHRWLSTPKVPKADEGQNPPTPLPTRVSRTLLTATRLEQDPQNSALVCDFGPSCLLGVQHHCS